MKPEEVTEQILSAWDEVSEPNAASEEEPVVDESTDEPEPEEGAEEPTEEPEEEAEEEAEEASVEGEEESSEDEEEPEEEKPMTATVTLPDTPEFRAWLARYQDDPQRALEGAYQLEKAMGRQGQEKAVLTRRVQELETALADATAFDSEGVILNEEQRRWAGEAIESGNPALYVREALRANEFGLARSICAEWGREDPYNALRASQIIDATEANTFAGQDYAEELPVDHGTLLGVLVTHFPEMPQYEQKMVETLTQLGPNHPLAVDARSTDPEQAARGVIGIYEIARASTHALASTREQMKNGNREEAKSARKRAVVSSAEASPSPSEAPRSVKLGPGLTLEQLDAEWSRNA